MNISSTKWFGWLLLTGIYVLGVLGVVGCGSGDDVVVDCGPGWVWNGTVCSRRTDGFNSGVSSISPALEGSGDLYAVGAFTHFKNDAVKHVARVNSDGSLDRGFVSNTDFMPPNVVVSANDGSGDIYIGGYLIYNGPNLPIRGIARLNHDGSLDSNFNTGAGIGRMVSTIVPATDGSGDVYVGGSSHRTHPSDPFENGPIRLNSDGSLDTDFNSGFRAGESSIALATDGSGDIYVSRNSAPYIARLNDDGTIDTGFDTGPTGFDRSVSDIAVATDGSGDIYVTGFFSAYNTASARGLVRLNSDGSIDAAFVADTTVFRFQGGRFIVPALDGSGDIYVGVTNALNEGIVRLNDDGSIDAGFASGFEGFGRNDTLSDAALAADGSGDIYVAGSLASYKSTPVVNLVRITAGGDLVK
ncbi:MAG: hypothetical protein OEZ08_00935 [Betaproteobacteria bacterium]|nr:hypothetical protein [Betaproteobacteria bacterium]